MKAKEYFQHYVSGSHEKNNYLRVVRILEDMFKEVHEIRDMRKAKTNSAMIAIFNEQNKKANSFIRKVNEKDDLQIKKDAFKITIREQMPELAEMLGWSDEKKKQS